MASARKLDVRKLFQPSDAIAFVVIAMGLFIALFLDDMAVRLIGVCIAILGGVALFMMISPRIADLSIEQSKRRTVSQPTDISADTREDASGKRITFASDDYRTQFGGDATQEFFDDKQGVLFDEARPKPRAASSPTPPVSQALVGTQLGDGNDGITVVGVRTKVRANPNVRLVVEQRKAKAEAEAQRAAADSATPVHEPAPETKAPTPMPTTPPIETVAARTVQPPARSSTSVDVGADVPVIDITSIDGDVAVSDDVVIRKRPKSTPPPPSEPAAEATPTLEPTTEPAIDPEPIPIKDESTPEETQPPAVAATTPEPPPARTVDHRVTLSDLVDDVDAFDGAEPRKEFDHLLNRVLQVIRSMINARTAAFLWVSAEQRRLVVESTITDVSEGVFRPERKLPLGDDVVSQIALHGRPEILTEIRATAELDLLPYYSRPAGTQSFIGVPVYYGNTVVGVLCADAKEPDAYDSLTVGFFGHFTKLISGLIQSYTGKYDLQQSARILKAIEILRSYVRERGIDQASVLRALINTTIECLDVVTLGLVLFDEERGWNVVHAASGDVADYDALVGSTVDLDRSVVGAAIASGTTVDVACAPGVLRVTPAEPVMETGQFLAIPIRSFTGVYGALYVENPMVALSQQDTAILEALCDHAGTFLEHVREHDLVQHGAMFDESSGIMNRVGFQMRLQEECARSVDYEIPFTTCIVRLDPSGKGDDDPQRTDRVLLHVLSKLRNELRPYDLLGRIDVDQVAVGLVGAKAQQAQIWTERMRKEIASSIIDIDGKRFTATVSIGVAEAVPTEQWDRVLDNAYHALTIAGRQGNKVVVFA